MIAASVIVASLALGATSESVLFVGDAAVNVEGVYDRTFSGERLVVDVKPADEKTWTIEYEREGFACRVRATGSREALVIAPGQQCTTKYADEDYRGTLVAHGIRGTLKRAPDGSERFEIRSNLRAENAARHVVKETPLGTIDTWVPLGTRSGTAAFKGTKKAPED